MDERIAELERRIAKLEEYYNELNTIKMTADDIWRIVLKEMQNATRNADRHPL